MYKDFYSLSAEPFRLSPDPQFCYRHPSYAKARAYMQYALERGEGFVLVTGVPGTGKTTLIEDLLTGLEGAPVIVSHLTTTQLQGDDLLRMVCYEIGADAQGLDKATLLRRIQEGLLHQAGKGQRSLLLVDEAQALSESALEELRLLTNLQVNRRPLLQIFLVGQEPLRRMVAKPSMEQLKQRVLAACHLQPLKLKETREYLRHRLNCAGWRGDPIISGDVVRLVQAASLGIPRRINIVADRLLLHGYVEGKHELGEADASVVVLELHNEQLFSPGPEEIAAKAAVSDLDASVPLALLGESAEPDKQAPAKAVAAVQAERRGSAPGFGNVARLAVREVPTAAALPVVAPDGDDRFAAVTPGRAEIGMANKPAQLVQPPTDRPNQQPGGGQRGTAVQGVPASARAETPVGDTAPKHTAWRYALAGVMFLSFVAFAVVLGRPDVVTLVKSHWAAWSTGLRHAVTGSTIRHDGRPASPGTTSDTIPPAAPAPKPIRDKRPDPFNRQSEFPAPVRSGVMDAAAARQTDEGTHTSLSGLEFSQGADEAVAVVTSGARGISVSKSSGLPEPDARSTSTAEVDAGDLQETTLGAAGRTQPTPVLSAPIEPVASVATPIGTLPQAERAGARVSRETPGEPPPSTPDQTEPLAAVAVQFDTPPQADGSSRSPAAEIRREQPPMLESLHAGLRQLGLPVRRLDPGALKLSLRKEIPFRFDSAEVPERSRQVLDRLAALLGEHRHWTLTVIGHTDDTGPDDYNLRLSLERAGSVADYLVQRGLPGSRVFSEGKGESEPAAAGEMAAGYRKWLDRRIEIVIRSTDQLPRQDMASPYR